LAARLGLDGVELGDTIDWFFRDGGALRLLDIDELASDMGHAGNLPDGARTVKYLEAGVAIPLPGRRKHAFAERGMHPAGEAFEVFRRPFTLAIDGEPVPRRRWSFPDQGRSSRP
jgi:hypothetical protein